MSPKFPADGTFTRCARCGASFTCGMVSGGGKCWCGELPPLAPVPGRSCLCRACLEKELPADGGRPAT